MNITRGQWNAIKKGIAELGIDFKIHDACCIGCIEDDTVAHDQPAIQTLKKCYAPLTGGFLYHQNIAGTELAEKLVDLFEANGAWLNWDRSDEKAMFAEAL